MIAKRTPASQPITGQVQERWYTVYPDPNASHDEHAGVAGLQMLREGRLPPNSGPRKNRTTGEVFTYLREGSLVYRDSAGPWETMLAGEFRRTTLGPGSYYQETNASPTHWAQLFQVWLTPNVECQPGSEMKRFASGERRKGLRLVASPDGRQGSLTVHQDAFIYSGLMGTGRHVVHPLGAARTACLYVLAGGVDLPDATLNVGDMALVTGEASISFSSKASSEILLLDLRQSPERMNGASLSPPSPAMAT